MRKYRLVKAMIFGTVLSLGVLPMTTFAEEKKYSWIHDEDLDEKAKEAGKKIVNWSSEVEQKVNEKLVDPVVEFAQSIPFYHHDSLWLITDIPEANPNEKRNYYFVNKNTPTLKWTFYYNEDGRSISKNADDIAKIEIREMYLSVTNPECVFKTEHWLDCKNGTYTVNYVSLDCDNLYSPVDGYDYGKFSEIDDMIPENKRKEKYSTEDLKDILDIINDVDYTISQSDKLTKKRFFYK